MSRKEERKENEGEKEIKKETKVCYTSYDYFLLIYLGLKDFFNRSYASTNLKEFRER